MRETRDRVGISQRSLAFPGCSPAYLSRIEAGDRTPSLQVLRELARRLGVTEEYLAYGIEEEPAASDPLFEADLAFRMDELDRAETLYREVLAVPDTGAARRAQALEGLGQLAFTRNELSAAIQLLEEAKELYAEDAPSHSSLYDTLGRSYSFTGESERAITIFRRSLAHAQEREDVLEQVRFSVLLSSALSDAGRLDDAEQALGPALEHADDLHDPTARSRLYWAQCRLHMQSGRPDLAERYGRKLLDLLERMEDSRILASALRLMVVVELDRDRPVEALDYLERARAALGDSAEPVDEAMMRLAEARALAQLGELERAASQAMAVADELSERPDDAGYMYSLLAATFAERGDSARAIEIYELACELLERGPNRHLRDAYARLAELLEAEGRKDQAFQVLKKAVGARVGQEASGR